jgi:hypothetical protein
LEIFEMMILMFVMAVVATVMKLSRTYNHHFVQSGRQWHRPTLIPGVSGMGKRLTELRGNVQMLLADPADHFAALLDFNPFQCCRALGISLQAIVARILSDLFFLRFRHGSPLVLLGGKAIVRTRRKAQGQNCGENSENCFGHTTLPFLIHTTETECNFKMSDLNENRQTRNRVKAVSVAFAQLRGCRRT